ncbi:MAG: hypothetical protein ACRCTJ_02885 [Brevinema sp.]
MNRHNFYKGELVTPEELNGLQDYSDGIVEEVIARGAIGTGIVMGFLVTKANELTISIESGLAYGVVGEVLRSNTSALISINDYLPTLGSKKVFISMKKDYTKTDPVQDNTGNIVNTTWTPTVLFEISNFDQGIPTGSFELAIITLNSQGIVEIEQISPNVPFKADRDAINFNSLSFNWNGQSIIDIIYPKGYQYTQYPNDLGIFEPIEEPSSLFGGVWELIHNDKSVFFRTEGERASLNRQDGIQLDATQKMTGNVGCSWDAYSTNGVFKPYSGRTDGRGTSGTTIGVNFDNSRQVRTADEEIVINMLMRIWKRIA